MTVEWAVLAVVLGVVCGLLAERKGRSFAGWLVFGFLLWPVAVPWALLARDRRAAA